MALFGLLGRKRSPQDRMDAMMQRLDVDVIALAEGRPGQDLAAATVDCEACARVGRCESWLDGKAVAGKGPDTFCPNAALFAQNRRT